MKVSPTRTLLGLLSLAVALSFLPPWKQAATAKASLAQPRKSPVRVGLVFDVGGRGDKSFNDAAFAGLERAEQELGVEVGYLEPVGSEDREAAMRLFAARGFDLVIGVGFIFSSDVDAVALDYPHVHFACIDYFSAGPSIPHNVAGLAFREEEGAFLVGAVAGMLTKTKHLGFVGGMQNPLIRKFEAGYEAGAKAVCSECVTHGGYAGMTPDAFRDPAKGKSLAISQIAAKADVFFHASGATGHGVFEAAHDARVMAIGVDADQYDEMPDTIVTSLLKRGDVAVFEIVRSVIEKRFKPGMNVLGLAEGAIDFVHDGPHAARIPDAVKARVFELRKDIVEGRIHVPVQ